MLAIEDGHCFMVIYDDYRGSLNLDKAYNFYLKFLNSVYEVSEGSHNQLTVAKAK
jgi:hypothetical protein